MRLRLPDSEWVSWLIFYVYGMACFVSGMAIDATWLS